MKNENVKIGDVVYMISKERICGTIWVPTITESIVQFIDDDGDIDILNYDYYTSLYFNKQDAIDAFRLVAVEQGDYYEKMSRQMDALIDEYTDEYIIDHIVELNDKEWVIPEQKFKQGDTVYVVLLADDRGYSGATPKNGYEIHTTTVESVSLYNRAGKLEIIYRFESAYKFEPDRAFKTFEEAKIYLTQLLTDLLKSYTITLKNVIDDKQKVESIQTSSEYTVELGQKLLKAGMFGRRKGTIGS